MKLYRFYVDGQEVSFTEDMRGKIPPELWNHPNFSEHFDDETLAFVKASKLKCGGGWSTKERMPEMPCGFVSLVDPNGIVRTARKDEVLHIVTGNLSWEDYKRKLGSSVKP